MGSQGCQDSSSNSTSLPKLCNTDEVCKINASSTLEVNRQNSNRATETACSQATEAHPQNRRIVHHPSSNKHPEATAFSILSLLSDSTTINNMSDGSTSKRFPKAPTCANPMSGNEARALRVLEIMNDFRTLQVHTTSLVTREEANPPDQTAYYLDGYVVLRQCNAEAQAILASHYNPGNIGLEPGSIPGTEVQKATLQRIILDASTRRFSVNAPIMMLQLGRLTLDRRTRSTYAQELVYDGSNYDNKSPARIYPLRRRHRHCERLMHASDRYVVSSPVSDRHD